MGSKVPVVPILILIVIITVGVFVGGQFKLELPSGSTPLSLSQATFQSSNQFFNERLWILTIIQGGLGTSARGTLDNDEIKQKSGEKPANDINVDINYVSQACEYPIQVPASGTRQIELLNRREWSCLLNPSETEARNNGCTGQFYYAKYGNSFTCFCLQRNPQTSYVAFNSIGNANIHTISNITVSSGGKVETKRFDTQGNIADYVGSNVYAQWNGDLIRQTCPSQNSIYGFYQNGQWKIGSSNAYNNYNSYVESTSTQLGQGVTKDWADNVVTLWNQKANSALTPMSFGSGITNSANVFDAKIVAPVSTPVSSQVFTLFVKANWIGFAVPQPKPVLISATPAVTFKSGEGSQISITYRNDGDSGNVDVTVACGSGLSVSQNSAQYSIQAGGTQTSTLSINGDTSQPKTSSCQICVYPNPRDINQPAQCGTTQVNLNPQSVCTANIYSCVGQKIYKCNQYGSSNDIVQECPSGQLCDINSGGVGYCKTSSADACQLPTDCDDHNPQTEDKCVSTLLGRRCQNTPILPVCGDGVCNGQETSQTCPRDCGPSLCDNDNICEPASGETYITCPTDCQQQSTCNFNNRCEVGETTASCPTDCRDTGGNDNTLPILLAGIGGLVAVVGGIWAFKR